MSDPSDIPSGWAYPVTTPHWARHPRYRSLFMIGTDAVCASAALYGAYLLRFDGATPAPFWFLPVALSIILPIRLALAVAFGIHHWSFRVAGFHEATRLLASSVLATFAILAVTSVAVTDGALLPRSVLALEFFLTTGFMGFYRFAPRLLLRWHGDRKLLRTAESVPTLVVGASHTGDLLVRDLSRSPSNAVNVVGFLDDDPNKLGSYISGKRVLGSIADLPRLIEKHGVKQVLIAIADLPAHRIRTMLGSCASLQVRFKIMPASFFALDAKISATMLHELSPEHLLPRNQVVFEASEIAELVGGRRILITGAAGSIGSEISRQVAAHGAATLVLVDRNENDLYFLARSLQEKHPHLSLHTVLADIQDHIRMNQLGEQFRPQDIFHAAAHKHVPLMEDSPAEAVRNNVLGTRNVAEMADRFGVERFVLISTDKAVSPSSVMGASKRLAEMIIRDIARTSETSFCAVRFGNVLGSAGSVVPLFKQQIQRGMPLTITHPDCTRYFMTVREAVGLLVIAGLGGFGELCILEMGEPIRIRELAESMITMAGLVVGRDVPIIYTGLRPGEKLTETLLTDEEERTRGVRQKILVAHSPPSPVTLHRDVTRLGAAAVAGDADAVIRLLEEIIPSYRPHRRPRFQPAPSHANHHVGADANPSSGEMPLVVHMEETTASQSANAA